MIIARLALTNFRNHANTVLEFGPGINVLLGSNGQGKTNILEGASYLSLTKSFFAAGDGTVLTVGENCFEIEGRIVSEAAGESLVHIAFDRHAEEKRYLINRLRQDRLASVIGMFPMVILSPEKNAITFGAPAERRKFVDLVLSQLSRSYFEDLLEYRRVLKQRNRMLADGARGGRWQEDALLPWTSELTRYGSRIVLRRHEFLRDFEPFLREAYIQLAGNAEEPGLRYVSGCEGGDEPTLEDIAAAMLRQLDKRRDEERRRGLSLVGPHRDDVALSINGMEVQKYASQGQHKTYLVALKIAEFRYVRQRREEAPLFLLDDVFSELDADRCRRILELGSALGQVLLTTTEESSLRGAVSWNADNRKFLIEQGTARPA